MKRAITVLALIGVIGAGAGAYYIKNKNTDAAVNTAPISRGDIIDTVGATGTLQAVTTVQVGSQVSGNISWLGADFNSIVHKNQVIARLDPALFQAAVEQARANLAKSKADVEHNQVALVDAQQKYTRAKELGARNLLPQSDLDAAKVAVDSAQAMLLSSQAAVQQAQANLNQAQVSLDHTIITAPIDGIVIQRSVDVGQTVAASMQAPTLFVIAADLTKMQVNANIDEADVGRIRPDQTVTFHVDAYPTEEFRGTVAQIRLQPVVVQNVTTYGTIINVPNDDLKLKPGMTANLKVEIARRSDVLRVPNATLRFRPTSDMFAALNQPVPPEVQGRGQTAGAAAGAAPGSAAPGGAGGRGFGAQQGTTPSNENDADRRARLMDRFKTMSHQEQQQFIDRMKSRGQDVSAFQALIKPAESKPAPKTKAGASQGAETIDALFAPLPPVESRGRLWLYMNKQLKPVSVRLGITDGTNTELLEPDLQVGTPIVTGIVLGGARTTSTSGSGNPLMPGRGGPGGFGGGPGRGR
jgi:HlyD family secretion protein